MELRYYKYVFGPFIIDTGERLLRRNGDVFPLAPKGAEILLLLLDRAGELVTKEEIRERVWEGAFVEENSVAQTVSRLRRALVSDFEGENPIQTVSKRGYRMGVAVLVETLPIQQLPRSEPAALAASGTELSALSTPQAASEGPVTPPNVADVPSSTHAVRVSPLFTLAASVAALTILVALFLWKHPLRPATQTKPALPTQASRRSIAILGFQNLSGKPSDAWLATALSEMMYSELLADGTLRVVPNGLIAQAHRSAATFSTSTLPPAAIIAAGRQFNCDIVLHGDYIESGGRIRVDLLLQDAHTGETLGAFTRTDLADQLLPLVAVTGEDVRRGLGQQSLSPTQKEHVLASVATNPDALRSYSQGLNLLRSLDAVGAQPYLDQSIRLEPDYPMSHVALSYAWTLLGYEAKAIAESQRATELSSNLSEEEKLEVQARFYEASTQWDKATDTYQNLCGRYPDDIEYGLALGRSLVSAGKAQEALKVVAKLHNIQTPGNSDPRIDLLESDAQSSLSSFALAAKAAETGINSAKARSDTFILSRLLLQWGKNLNTLGDPPKARAAFSQAGDLARQTGDRGIEIRAMAADAKLALQGGDAESAKREDFAAIDLAKQIGDRHEQISLMLDLTQVFRPQGNLPAQRDYAEQALHLAQQTSDKNSQAIALLDLGNALNNEGHVDLAQAAYEQCITLSRLTGDRGALSRALGNLALVDYAHGNLSAAQPLLEEGISISRATGEKSSVAYKLGQYAIVLMYENRLPQARAALKEQCDIDTQLGARRDLATCQVITGELDIAEGHPQDAIAPLTLITQTYSQINPAASAWDTLAEAQLALHNTKEAGIAIHHADELAHDTKNPAEFRIPMGLLNGRYQAAMGEDATALRTLQNSRDAATRLKLLPIALRARLYIAEVESVKKPALASSDFDQLGKEAEHAGFLRIASLAKSDRARLPKQ